MLGRGGVLFSKGGSVQSGLMGEGVEVGVGDGLEGEGDMSMSGNNWQPIPNRRDGIRIKQAIKYFIFILLNVTIIVAHGYNLSKNKGPGIIPAPYLITYAVALQVSEPVLLLPFPQGTHNQLVFLRDRHRRLPYQSARVRYEPTG